jgi:DamX protein
MLDKGTTLSDKVDSIKPGEDVKQIQPESNQNILITADTKPETVEQPTLIPPNNGLVTTQPIEQKTVEVESEQPKVVVVDKNIKKIKEVKPKPTITKTNNHSNKYVQKILKFPNNHYTLQLLGASDIKGIERFIINNKLQNQAYYYCTTHNKKPWYILIYGNYSTKEQAKNAITRLPTTVQALHPWARDFSSVKKTLQTRN